MRLQTYITERADKTALKKIEKAIKGANSQSKMNAVIKMVQGYDSKVKKEKDGIGFSFDFIYGGGKVGGSEITQLLGKVQGMLDESKTPINEMTKKVKAELVGTALQIVYEYPNWGAEHIEDMYQAVKQGGRPKFSIDDLEDMTVKAARVKKTGKKWKDAEKELMRT